MASTASDLLKLELQTDGENDSTWGALAVVLFERLEEAVAEQVGISLNALGGANYTLDDTQYVKNSGTTAESHAAIIKATGTLDAAEQIIVPLRNKSYIIWNATSGSFAVTVGGATGDTVTIPQGYLQKVICDGTNVEAAGPAVDTNGAINLNGQALYDTNGNELISFTETASAVNQVQIVNAATGNPAILEAAGETNVGLLIRSKGTGNIELHDAGSLQMVVFNRVASAVNELALSNAATGNGPQIEATGGDTNIDLELIPKGTGGVQLADKPIKRPVLVDYGETVNDIGSTGGGTQDIDLELGNVVKLTVDTSTNTFTVSNWPASGTEGSVTLKITNGGSQTVNWPAAVIWAGGSAPNLTASGLDYIILESDDAGTTIGGFTAGLDMS